MKDRKESFSPNYLVTWLTSVEKHMASSVTLSILTAVSTGVIPSRAMAFFAARVSTSPNIRATKSHRLSFSFYRDYRKLSRVSPKNDRELLVFKIFVFYSFIFELKRFKSVLLDGTGVKWLVNVVEFSRPIVFEALVEGGLGSVFCFWILTIPQSFMRLKVQL